METTVCRTTGLGQLECWCVVVYAVTVLHVHICVLEARMNLHEGGRGCAHEALRGCPAVSVRCACWALEVVEPDLFLCSCLGNSRFLAT